MDLLLSSTCLAALLANIGLGGGIFEHSVVDPAWPHNPTLIQPAHGGISRRFFWIPAHVAFELSLLLAVVLAWSSPEIRGPLLLALASHTVMRVWSGFDMIPRAIAFEKADPATITVQSAQRWSRRSLARLPLALMTSLACLAAVVAASGAAI